jgi:4-oxalocrotonate tautomerase
MPHVIVKMWPGRSERAKELLAEAITRDVMTFAKVAEASVSVAIEEVPREAWTAEVYQPEIVEKRAPLYRRPGYKPSDYE